MPTSPPAAVPPKPASGASSPPRKPSRAASTSLTPPTDAVVTEIVTLGAAPLPTGNAAVLGIDPGSRATGLCVRMRNEVIAAVLVERRDTHRVPRADYVAVVVAQVQALLTAMATLAPTVGVTIAVEDVNAPTPQMGLSNPGGLLGTAVVLGAVLGVFPQAVVVAPASHGSALLATYPAVLRSPKERSGRGKRRHLRSAFDVAGAPEVRLARTQSQGSRTPH